MCAATPDLDDIYRHQAERYQDLIAREDHEGNLLRALQQIVATDGIDVLETGAGTGRIALMLAPSAHSVRAFDLNPSMLAVARSRAGALGYRNVAFEVGDHLGLRAERASADLIIAGWSMCYLYLNGGSTWRDALSGVLADFQGFLRPGGTIILIETLGTGHTQPVRLPVLAEYLDYLDEVGFHSMAVRTDYRFDDVDQARDLSTFFFGTTITDALQGCILPECTGLWWKSRDE